MELYTTHSKQLLSQLRAENVKKKHSYSEIHISAPFTFTSPPLSGFMVCHFTVSQLFWQVSLKQELCFSSVPPQPVPPLAHTLQGYLKALEPLLPPEELSHTCRMVQEFGRPGGLGARLQKGLEKRARNTKNWVSELSVCVWEVSQVWEVDYGRSSCVLKSDSSTSYFMINQIVITQIRMLSNGFQK